MGTPVQRTPRHEVTVAAVEQLTARMRRITVAGPSLVSVRPRPAQDVELVLTEPTGRRVKRRYTIRTARPDRGEFDLDVLLHGSGPGARWGADARPGETVTFFGPRGRLVLADADWHLFAGDEAALPAIATLLEALPVDRAAVALIEVGGPQDELPMARAADVRWLYRGAASTGRADVLAASMAALPRPAGSGHGYLLGESQAMIALRPALLRLGLDAQHAYVKGYWNVGRQARQ